MKMGVSLLCIQKVGLGELFCHYGYSCLKSVSEKVIEKCRRRISTEKGKGTQ